MTTDTPTPRVDAFAREICERSKEASDLPSDWNHVVPADFARALERDLAACRADWDAEHARYDELGTKHEATLADLAACRAALRELVACQDMHDKIENNDFATYQGYASSCAYYRRRVPLAMSAARAILQSTGEGETK